MSSLGHRIGGAFSFWVACFGVAGAALVVASAAAQAADPGVRLLSEYLAIDSADRPGTLRAISWLHRQARSQGLQTTLVEGPNGCRSVVVRLPATQADAQAPLVLLHHADVVAAEADEWQVPPFAGRVADGVIWGRGAIDAKGLGIAHLMALQSSMELADRRRDLLLVATCDEETGGREGVGWLLERHLDWFPRGTVVLNEGGGNRVMLGQDEPRLFHFGIEVAQKRPLWLKVTARGRGGHGSMPWGNPVTQLVHGLQRLDEELNSIEPRLTPQLWWALRATGPLAGEGAEAERFRESLSSARAVSEEIRSAGRWTRSFPPATSTLFSDTMAITHLEAGSGVVNVVPSVAEALIDLRMLPDTDQEALLVKVRELLGSRLEVEVLLDAPAVGDLERQLFGTVEWQAMRRVLGREAPVHPTMIASSTDSRYFRSRGIAAYGLSPFVLAGEYTRGIHGADERIPVDVFVDGIERMRRIVHALLILSEKSGPAQ